MGLLETAVPWFFLTSGFFLFGKMDVNKEKDLAAIRVWIEKVLKLYLVWTVVYFPFAIIGFCQDYLPFAKAVVVWLRNVILVGENYLSWPLWYLLALIWGGALIWLMRHVGLPVWAMFVVGLVLYLAARVFRLDEVPIYEKLFKTTRNGLFFGLMFLAGGGLIRQWVSKVKVRHAIWWDIALIVGAFVGFQFCPFFLLPLAAGLFLLSLRVEIPGLSDSTSKRLGAMSKVIYLTHMLFAGLFLLLTGLGKGIWLFVITAACATAIAWLFAGRCKGTKIEGLLFS